MINYFTPIPEMLVEYIYIIICFTYNIFKGTSKIGRAERKDKNRGRISASRNSEIFEYSFGVF